MPMNVILLERVPKLGQMGDVVKVKPGFARNYLLPQKKALRATKDNITYFESQRKTLEAQNLERRKEAEAVGAKMSDLKVTLIRQASEALQLYGSVTSRDIADGGRRRRRQDRAQPGRARQADQGAGRAQDQGPPPSGGHGRDHRAGRPLARRGRVPRQGRHAGRRDRARGARGGGSRPARRRAGRRAVRGQARRRRRGCRRDAGRGRGRGSAGRKEVTQRLRALDLRTHAIAPRWHAFSLVRHWDLR